MKKLKKIWQDIIFKLFMLKVRWWMISGELKDKRMRKKYCRKGYHKLHKVKQSIGTYKNNRMYIKHYDHWECKHCNFRIATSKYTEDRFNNYSKNKKKICIG